MSDPMNDDPKLLVFLGAGASQFAGNSTFANFSDLLFNSRKRADEQLPFWDAKAHRFLEDMRDSLLSRNKPLSHDNFIWLFNEYRNRCKEMLTDSVLKVRFLNSSSSIYDFLTFKETMSKSLIIINLVALHQYTKRRIFLTNKDRIISKNGLKIYLVYKDKILNKDDFKIFIDENDKMNLKIFISDKEKNMNKDDLEVFIKDENMILKKEDLKIYVTDKENIMNKDDLNISIADKEMILDKNQLKKIEEFYIGLARINSILMHSSPSCGNMNNTSIKYDLPVEEPLHIFTTNYDSLLEEIAEYWHEVGKKIKVVDGMEPLNDDEKLNESYDAEYHCCKRNCADYFNKSGNAVVPNYAWSRKAYKESGKNSNTSNNLTMYYYKLHGCFAWFPCPNYYRLYQPCRKRNDECRGIIQKPCIFKCEVNGRELFSSSYVNEDGLTDACTIIHDNDAFGKHSPHEFYFNQFCEKVSKAKSILFIGCSFNDEDIARAILISRYHASLNHNGNKLKIISVNPTIEKEEIINSFKRFANKLWIESEKVDNMIDIETILLPLNPEKSKDIIELVMKALNIKKEEMQV